MGMMLVVLIAMRWDSIEIIERTRREWMVLLMEQNGEVTERMIKAVKVFLERMRCVKCSVWHGMPCVVLPPFHYMSCHCKGLTLHESPVTPRSRVRYVCLQA